MTREEIDQILTGAGQASAPQTMMTREQIDSIISGGQSPMQTNSGSTGVQIPAVSAAQKQTKNNPVLNRTLGMATHTSQALLGMSAADLKSKAKLLQRTASQKQEADDSKMPQQNQTANNAETASLWNAVERGGLSPREKLDKEMLQNKRIADNADIPQINNMNKEEYADSLVKYSADALTRLPSLKPQVDIPALDQPLAEVKSGERKPWSYDEFMEKSFEHAKHNAGRYSVNTPEVVKETYLDKWLQPGYKMNRDEIKQAKQYLKENALYYSGAGIDGQGDRRKAAQAAQIVSEWKGISPQEYMEKWDKLDKLHSKVNVGSSFFTGIESALPFITTLNDKYEKALNQWDKNAGSPVDRFDADYKGHFEERQGEAITQNPVPYVGGYLGTQMAKYKMGTAALDKLGVTGKLSGALSKVIKNEKVAGHAANVLGDTSLDVAFDTVPSLVGDVKEGEDAGTVAKNAAKNIGTNIAFNIGGEAVGAGISAISKSKKVKNILANPDTFTIETGVRLTGDGKTDKKIVTTYLDELDKATAELAKSAPVDDIVKSTPADDVVKNVPADDVAKSVPADDVVESAVKNTDDGISQIIEDVSKKPQKEVFDPVEKAFREPDVQITHSPEQLKQMQEYYNSGNDEIIDFAKKARNDKYIEPIEVATVSDKAAQKIKELTGISTTDNKIVLDKSAIQHIDNRHGIHGAADHSMADDKTLSRIGYVLDNFDDCFLGDGKTGKVRLANGEHAPKVVFYKKIDGTYYVVEGITDAKSKTNRIVSAYTKKEAYLMPDVRSIPKRYVQDEAEFTSFTDSIPDTLKNSNNEIPSPNTMGISKVDQFSNGTGPEPAVSADPLKGSNATPARTLNAKPSTATSETSTGVGRINSMLENSRNVNNEIPSPATVGLPRNKTMAEDIGLNSRGLPWETPGGAKSVAEEMGIPDIRKYQQPQGDTITVGGEKVSKFRTNTMAREGNFSPDEDAEVYCKELYKYIPKSEKETFDIAASRIASDADGWYKKIMEAEEIKGFDNAEGVDTMMQLSMSYRQQARTAKEAGNMELARSYYAKSRDMTMKLAAEERKAGQELQALKKYTRPSDKLLIDGEKRLQNRVEKFAEANPKLMKEVDGVGDAIYRRVRELEETSDLWKQLAEADLSETAGTEARNQLRKQVADIIKQEAGKNRTLRKKLKNSTIDKLAEDILELNNLSKISSELESLAATGVYGVSDDVIDQVTDILADAEKYHVNSKERVLLENKAGRILAEEVAGTSIKEMWEAWRYACMLLSPATWVRNIGSTAGMCATNGIKNSLAALMEAAVAKSGKNIDRTKAVLSIADHPLAAAALKDADNTMYRELKGNRFFRLEDAIEGNKRVFKGNNKVTSALAYLPEKLTKTSGNILDAQDYFFVKRKYSTSLTGYMKANGMGQEAFGAADQFRKIRANIDELTAVRNFNPFQIVNRAADAEIAAIDEQIAGLKNARGLNPLGQVDNIGKIEKLEQKAEGIARKRIDDQIAALKGKAEEYRTTAELLDKGRQYAKSQAEESAFHQDNEWANALSEFSRRNAESKHLAGKVMHMLIEGNVPFKKTPANVLKNGVEYSPINFALNNIADFFPKIGRVAKGTVSLNEAIDSLSKTLTGTGLFAAGWFAYENGIASAIVDKFEKLTGEQDYSLRIGGKSYTLDWAAPGSIPFFAGVTIAEDWEKSGFSLESLFNILAGIGQPVIEMSMMNGISNTLDSIQYMDKDDPYGSIGTLVGTSLGSYFNQGFSSSGLGRIARAVDNTRRSTYTDKTGFAGTIDRAITKGMNKIPALSDNNQPYIDTWGREQQNLSGDPGMVGRLAYQMLSPGYMSDINVTPVDQEVQRLYDATSDKAVLPSDSTKKINDVRMSKEEYTTYSKAAGQARYNLLESCLSNANYKALDEDVQAEVVKDLYGLAKKIGSAETRADYETKDNLFKTYQENGLDAAVNYAITAQAEDVTWVPISKTDNSERYDQVNSMDMSDDEKGRQLRMGANNSEVADRVYDSFDNSDSAVYDYYTLDEMAKNDSSNKTEKGEAKTFSQSSLGKQYTYINKMDGTAEEKGKMIASVNSSNEKVQTIYNAFGGNGVLAYAQLDSLAREDANNVTEDGKQKSFGQSNISNQYRYVERLGDNVSKEVKGTIIALNQTSSDKVQAVFKKRGGWGVMEYAKIKCNAHRGDGELTAEELKIYLNRHYTQTSSKKYWFSMVGNKNWKNPY